MEWHDGNITAWQDHNVAPSLLLISYTMHHHRRSETVVTHGKCSYILIYGYVYCFYQYIQKYLIFLRSHCCNSISSNNKSKYPKQFSYFVTGISLISLVSILLFYIHLRSMPRLVAVGGRKI